MIVTSTCHSSIKEDHQIRSSTYAFFNTEWPGIHRQAKNLPIGNDPHPCPTDRKDEQLSDDASNHDGGITEEKELVETLDEKDDWEKSNRNKGHNRSTGMTMAQIKPRTHNRSVDAGMDGSSVFSTAERTSGYGESSSTWKSSSECYQWARSKLCTQQSCNVSILVDIGIIKVWQSDSLESLKVGRNRLLRIARGLAILLLRHSGGVRTSRRKSLEHRPFLYPWKDESIYHWKDRENSLAGFGISNSCRPLAGPGYYCTDTT